VQGAPRNARRAGAMRHRYLRRKQLDARRAAEDAAAVAAAPAAASGWAATRLAQPLRMASAWAEAIHPAVNGAGAGLRACTRRAPARARCKAAATAPPGARSGRGPCLRGAPRARTASERAAAPPPAWRGGWAGSSASTVGAPWRVRCRRGPELASPVGPRQPRSRLAPRCLGVALRGPVGRVGAGPLPNAWGSARKDAGLGERRLAPTKTTRYFEEQVLRKRPYIRN